MIYNNTEPNGETLLACLLIITCLLDWHERRYNITINDPAGEKTLYIFKTISLILRSFIR